MRNLLNCIFLNKKLPMPTIEFRGYCLCQESQTSFQLQCSGSMVDHWWSWFHWMLTGKCRPPRHSGALDAVRWFWQLFRHNFNDCIQYFNRPNNRNKCFNNTRWEALGDCTSKISQIQVTYLKFPTWLGDVIKSTRNSFLYYKGKTDKLSLIIKEIIFNN